MHVTFRSVIQALSLAGVLTLGVPAMAATAAPQDAQAGQSQDEPKQIALTEKQVEAAIAAQSDISAIMAKLPQNSDAPSPKAVAELDAAAQKHGFKDFTDYDQVTSNINLVLGGFDPQTKKFIGQEAAIKQQIAEVETDKTMSAKDKKEALADLNESLKSVTPLQFPGNVQIVGKYYDQLSALMSQDQQ